MELKISHLCPSCGGPVDMDEMDRLVTCPFCDVQNYMVDRGLLRYVLPDNIPDRIPRKEIFYFPYLRCKGTIFSCRGSEFDYKIMDTTHQGLFSINMPLSLGLRPQAMRLRPVSKGHGGKFIVREESTVEIMQRAAKIAENVTAIATEPLYHRAFIGETVSCIYLPIYIEQEQIYDGILNRPLGKAEAWLHDSKKSVRHRPQWEPRFIATLCPQCGAVMDGTSDCHILYCFNCHCCCAEKGGKLVPVSYRSLSSRKKRSLSLPFWRLEVTTNGIPVSNLAHFLQITNHPVVITRRHQQRNMEFWIPAFKIRPKLFLKLAKGATLQQICFPEGEKRLYQPLFPVTLPLKEAKQAMKSVIAATALNRRKVLAKLPSVNFIIKRSSLIFLPFEDTGHDLIQEHIPLTIASSAVRFGRKL